MDHNFRLLIVDDDRDFTEILSLRFTRLGISVSICGDAGACVRLFASMRPDLVLLDGNLPGNEGSQLICKLKELQPDVPLVMLSGIAESAFIAAACEAGVERYLLKPCSFADLQTAVFEFVKPPASVPEHPPACSTECPDSSQRNCSSIRPSSSSGRGRCEPSHDRMIIPGRMGRFVIDDRDK